MTFTKNQTTAFVLGALALSLIFPLRALLAAPRPIEDAETSSSVQSSDSSECQELHALKLAFLERRSYTPSENLKLSFEAALQAGEKDGEVAEKLVDFVVESLVFDKDFFFFRQKILTTGENESSPFHRDETLEKLRYSVDYYNLFRESFKAEGRAGLDKVLDRYAQNVRKDSKYLAFYKVFDDLLTRHEDEYEEGYNCPELGFKLKEIVVDAYLDKLRSKLDLVPMPIDEFRRMLNSVKGAEQAEFADNLTSVWFNVAFASDYKAGLDYRLAAAELDNRLSLLGEEVRTAFMERALERFKAAGYNDDYAIARFILASFRRNIRKELDAGDSEELEKTVADLVEREKVFNPCATSGSFNFGFDTALSEALGDLEVARPDLARRAYEEAVRLCLERGRPKYEVFLMDSAAFYCESIDAIVAADLPELEKLADRIAEKAYVHAALNFPNSPKNAGEEFIFFLYQNYSARLSRRYGDDAYGILSRAIKALDKSDKNNAKAFSAWLAKVRNSRYITR